MGRLFLLTCSQPGGSGISFLRGFRHHGSLPESSRKGGAPFPLKVATGVLLPPAHCSSSIAGLLSACVLASWLPGLRPACPPMGHHLLLPTTRTGLKPLLKSSPWLSRPLVPPCHPPSTAYRSPLREGGLCGAHAAEKPFREREH